MNLRPPVIRRRFAVAITAVALIAGAAVLPLNSSAQSLSQLNSQLGQTQSRANSLSSSIASLDHLISSLNGQITIVQTREAEVRGELAADRSRLAVVQGALGREQQLLAVLRARLARARMILSSQLVSNYESSKPNLNSSSFERVGRKDVRITLHRPSYRLA